MNEFEWTMSSLRDGAGLSSVVADVITREWKGAIIQSTPETDIDNASRGGSRLESSTDLFHALERLELFGAEILLVEDDLRRRGDPDLTGNVLFLGDRILRWADLSNKSLVQSTFFTGASGYPLNAFVLTISAEEARLIPQSEISDLDACNLASAVSAVVTSAFDAEGFILLSR